MEAVLHQLPPVKGYSKRTSEDKDAAKAVDKKTHVELRALRSNYPENKCCADCTASLTGWASLPHGVFLCIACAQVHRSLGRHMAQVKSFSSGTYLWYPDEVAAMKLMGNANAEALYASPKKGAPPKPDKDAPAHIKDNYIRDKYERLKWVDPEFSYSSKTKALKKWMRKGKDYKDKLMAPRSSSNSSGSSSNTNHVDNRKTATSTSSAISSAASSAASSSPSSTTTTPFSAASSTDLSFASGYVVITGQPTATSPVYGGTNGKSLLDDDSSTRGCKAACLPVLSGLSIFKPSKSRWSCNNNTSYGTATSTRTASSATSSARSKAARADSNSKTDFFASWGL